MATTRPSQTEPHVDNQRLEVLKFAAQDFAESFYSLRSVEWKVAFQVFGGYILIATGYFWLDAKVADANALKLAATALVWGLWIVFAVFQLRLALSLRRAREMYRQLRARMFEAVGELRLDVPRLWWENWYGYICQQVLSFGTAAALTVAIHVPQVTTTGGSWKGF